MEDAEKTRRIEAFLADLNDLYEHHDIDIGSCSCCNAINGYSKSTGEHLFEDYNGSGSEYRLIRTKQPVERPLAPQTVSSIGTFTTRG